MQAMESSRLIVSAKGVRPADGRAFRVAGHRIPAHVLAALLLVPTASCVPSAGAHAPRSASTAAITYADASGSKAGLATGVAATIESFTAPPAVVDPQAAPTGVQPPGVAPALNAAIPFIGGPNPAASAFFMKGRAAINGQRSLQCLTEAIYYEAASESDDGQRAVAQVVLNRMRHPAYPASVCGVVYQNAHRWLACQFSFACDGARGRVPSASGWARARAHAAQALAGRVYAPVGLATHYHTWNVVPFWAHKLEKTTVVGAHIFYRLNGALGRGGAFSQRHAGYEPAPVPMAIRPAAADAPALALALAPLLPVKLSDLAPLAPAVPGKAVRSDAVPLPARETLTVPLSPIMRAVEGSTIREEFRNSGALKPEFAAK